MTEQQKALIQQWQASENAYETEARARPKPKKKPKPRVFNVPDWPKGTKGLGKPAAAAPSPSQAAPTGIDPATRSLLDAAVRLKFGGVEHGYQQQLAGAQRFASGVPTWYSQAMAQITSQQQPVAPVQAPAPTGDPAADSRANLNAAFSQQQAQRVGASNDFLTHVNSGLQVQQGQVLNDNARQQANIRSDMTGLAQQKGDFKTTFLADVDQARQKAALADRDYQFKVQVAKDNNLIKRDTLDALNLDRSADNRRDQTRIGNEKSRIRETKQQHAVDNALKVNNLALKSYLAAHPELKSKSPGKGGKSTFTPVQRRKSASTFRTLSGSMEENAVRKDPQGAVNALVKGRKTDPVVAQAVVESILNHGSVSRETATLYYRATGHHLHVSPKAKKTPKKNIGQVFQGILQNLGD